QGQEKAANGGVSVQRASLADEPGPGQIWAPVTQPAGALLACAGHHLDRGDDLLAADHLVAGLHLGAWPKLLPVDSRIVRDRELRAVLEHERPSRCVYALDLAVHVGCPGERDKRQGRDHDCYRHCDEALHTFHSPFPWVLCGCDRPASTHVAARVTP